MKQLKRSSSLDREIDKNLKRAFDEVLNQDVPDRFTDLLQQLRSVEATNKADKKEPSDD